jgi:hypothetical protein
VISHILEGGRGGVWRDPVFSGSISFRWEEKALHGVNGVVDCRVKHDSVFFRGCSGGEVRNTTMDMTLLERSITATERYGSGAI